MTRTLKKPNFTEGPMFFRILTYSLPIILSNIIQIFYNTADRIVVGQFSGDPNAIGAIGSTGTLTTLILNLVVGISVGISVTVAQSVGAGRDDDISRAVHTAITFALIGGICVSILGIAVTKPILLLLGTKASMMEGATLYAKIIFCGTLGTVVYNFGAAILRSVGDSKTPFIILTLSGIVNVVMNLVFVICFSMGIAGVALATIISKYIAATAVIVKLMRSEVAIKLDLRKLGIHGATFKRILKIGIPSAVQTTIFSISNMFIASALNTFTPEEVSGKTISANLEEFVAQILNGFYTATVTFVGQNYGAGKFSRLKRAYIYCMIWSVSLTFTFAMLEVIFAEPLSRIFVDPAAENAAAIVAASVKRIGIIQPFMFLWGLMNASTGYLRAIDCSVPPMISTLFTNGLLRVLWVTFVFPIPAFKSFEGLYIIYPITWAACFGINLIISAFVSKRAFRRKAAELEAKKA